MNSLKIKCKAFEIELHSEDQTTQELADVFSKVVQTTPPILTIIKEQPALSIKENDGLAQQEAPPTHDASPNSDARATKQKVSKGKGEEALAYRKVLEMIEQGRFDEPKSQPEVRRILSTAGYTISSKRLPMALLKLVREGRLIREGERRDYWYTRAEFKAENASTAGRSSENPE